MALKSDDEIITDATALLVEARPWLERYRRGYEKKQPAVEEWFKKCDGVIDQAAARKLKKDSAL